MSYLVVKTSPNATPESFQLTNACNSPRLAVGSSYIPLTNTGGSSCNIRVKDNNNTYRAMEYKSSSSSSSVQETTGYSGVSSRVSYYQTTLNNSAGLSSITDQTKVSTYATAAYVKSSKISSQYASQISRSSSRSQGYLRYTMSTSGTATSSTRRTTAANKYTSQYLGTFTCYNTQSNTYAGQKTSNSGSSIYNELGLTGGAFNKTTYLMATILLETTSVTQYTSVATTAYIGSSSRQSDYYTSSTDRANMSNITNLTASSSESASMMTWV